MGSVYAAKAEYAVSSWTYEERGLREALRDIADNGFPGVEIWGDTVHFDPRAGLDRRQIKEWLRETGLSLHSVHGPFRHFPVFASPEEFRAYRLRLLRETLDGCSECGAPLMVVHGLDRGEYNYRLDQLEILREDLGALCEYARRRGVQIALENIPAGGVPGEIPTNLQDHVKNFAGLGLKYCLDIGHAALNGADPREEAEAAGKDLVTFHIHNNDGKEDSHRPPDDGIIDWPALHGWFRQKGFEGRFVLEVLGGHDPEGVVRRMGALFSREREGA